MLGVSVTIYDMDISGLFLPDGSGMEDVNMAGAIDLRDIGDALGDLSGGLLSDPETACTLIVTFGVSCNTCPSDGENLCIDVELDKIEAYSTDTVIEPVEEADTHPDCEGGTEETPEF